MDSIDNIHCITMYRWIVLHFANLSDEFNTFLHFGRVYDILVRLWCGVP